MSVIDYLCSKFERDGYAVIDSFLTIEECDELKAAIAGVISDLDVKKEQKTVFGTEDGSEKVQTDCANPSQC